MAKQSEEVIFSDVFESIDIEVAAILRKCNNSRGFGALKANDKEKLWKALLNIIKSNNLEEASNDNVQALKVCTELVLSYLNSCQSNFENDVGLIAIMKFFNSKELVIDVPVLTNSISKVNEYWMAKIQEQEEISGMEYNTLKHLLSLCTCVKPLVADIQRLSSIRKAVTAAPFEKIVPSLKPLLIKLVEITSVLASEHGQRFIAACLLLSKKLMMDIHKTVMLDLSFCNKKKAGYYGKIYIMAWHSASSEIKASLEKYCIQHLMEAFLKEQRTSLELNKNSQNMMAVLEVWHSERKKKHSDFITMITNAYQPILWKYFQSGFHVHRRNAADVLFKAFPLQRSDDNAVEAENLFNLQYEAMIASLKDDCHIVRIIGIREVCNILSHYWNSFNSVQIQSLLKIITMQDAKDASSPEVRRMVYIGLQSLVKSPLSCEYMKQVLPFLSNNIHDINQRVRIAFIQLLICIKDKKDPTFKYSDVVSMAHIQYRLADDNAAVGEWIVKLLVKNYYDSKMPVIEWTKRFIYLIKNYKMSYRNFFFYSSKSIPFADACTIIYEILSQLGMFVLSKSEEVDKEDNENIIEKPAKKKRGNKKAPLSDFNERKDSTEEKSSSVKKCAFDDADVVSGLFDVVTILWVLHDIKLNMPENEEIRFKLYDTYIKYAQPFINYYKDTSIFLGILSLSGNIPASLLRNNSITLPGYCIKMLKSFNMAKREEDNEKIICMLMALVKWGRASEIFEQITLWLDAAFETQNMNETILPRRRVKINEAFQPNSVFAIHILDTVLKKEYAKMRILKKNYSELFRLWKFMSRVQQIIEIRLEQGEPFAEDLVSDEFLAVCFRRYVKLIPLLKEESAGEEEKEIQDETKEECISHQKEIEKVLEWGNNFLYSNYLENEELEEVELDLIANLLEAILYVSDNMIIVHFVDHSFYFKIGHFVIKLLNTKYGIRFVKASTRITAAINQTAKLLFNVQDDFNIFCTVIPSLLSHCLNALSARKFSSQEMEKFEEDLSTIKSNFSKVLATYQVSLKSTSNLKEKVRQLKLVVGLFVDFIIKSISEEISREDSSPPRYSSPAKLPPIANTLITLFYNKKTWTSLFIHLLNARISSRSEDLIATTACILLLEMYAVGDKKVNQEELTKALFCSKKKLTELKKSIGPNKKKPVVGEAENEMRLQSNASTQNNSSNNILPPESSEFQKNGSQEVLQTRIEVDGSQSIAESIKSCSLENDKNEKDLITFGFELIQNIETVLKHQSTEAEEDSS